MVINDVPNVPTVEKFYVDDKEYGVLMKNAADVNLAHSLFRSLKNSLFDMMLDLGIQESVALEVHDYPQGCNGVVSDAINHVSKNDWTKLSNLHMEVNKAYELFRFIKRRLYDRLVYDVRFPEVDAGYIHNYPEGFNRIIGYVLEVKTGGE